MLDTMRKIAGSVVAKLFLIVLVISFGLWGVGDIIRNHGVGYAAKVGADTISVGELQLQAQRTGRQMQAAGINVDAGKIQAAVLRQMVQQKLVSQALQEAGLYVDNTLIARAIAADSNFQTLDGKFSDTAYRTMLQQQHLSEAEFLQDVRKQVTLNFVSATLDMGDVTPPSAVLALAEAAAGETRDAVLVKVPAVADHAPTNDEIQAYYDAYKDTRYQQPERRTLEFVTPSAADIQALVDKRITPEMLKDAQAAAPQLPKDKVMEQLRAEQRDATLRDLSNTVEDALAAGASIGEAMAKAGLRAQSHVLSNVTADQFAQTRDELSTTVTQQGFALNEGEVSHLITTPKGMYVMVSAKSITPASAKPLSEVKDDAAQHAREQLSRDAAKRRAGEAKIALAEGKNWQESLAKLHLNGVALTAIKRPLNGRDSGTLPASLAQAVFEQPVGKVAGPLARPDGEQWLALVVASHHPKATLDDAAQKSLAKTMAEQLNSAVQAQALNGFAATRDIRINAAAMAPSGGE